MTARRVFHQRGERTPFAAKSILVALAGFGLCLGMAMFPCLVLMGWPRPTPEMAYRIAFDEKPPDFVSELRIGKFGRHFKGKWFLLSFSVPPKRLGEISHLSDGFKIESEIYPWRGTWPESKFAELAGKELKDADDLACAEWSDTYSRTTCYYSSGTGAVFVCYYEDTDFAE